MVEPTTIVISSGNLHKVAEIQALWPQPTGEFLSLRDFPDAPVAPEDTGTFAGNATQKAVQLASWLGRTRALGKATFVLADDSGLEVDALNGEPGVHSARFAAQDRAGSANSSDAENNEKLLRLMHDVPWEKRTARFRCCIALTPVMEIEPVTASPVCLADPWETATELFEGVCEGRIGFEKRGSGGFGYDPLFFPEEFSQTFAELGEAVKNRISHRARALARLKEHWLRLGP